MGMNPEDYYNMSPKDFAAKVEGYSYKLYRESSDRRRAAFLILLPHVRSGSLPFDKFCRDFWPLQMDNFGKQKPPEPMKVSHELFEKIMQANRKQIGEAKRKEKTKQN